MYFVCVCPVCLFCLAYLCQGLEDEGPGDGAAGLEGTPVLALQPGHLQQQHQQHRQPGAYTGFFPECKKLLC